MNSELLIAILVGLLTGSFFNMLIYRMTNKVSLISPAFSICPSCQHRLAAKDLIPVFSYLWLRGKCRYCQQKISVGYLVMELTAVLIAVTMVSSYGLSGVFFLKYFLYMLLIGAAVSDIKTGEIEYVFTMGSLIMVFFLKGVSFTYIYTAISVFIVFMALSFFGKKIYKKDVFGGADILLLTVGGYYFSATEIMLFIYLPFVIGGLWSIGVLLFSKNRIIAFAPFIVFSLLITDIWGWRIVDWYLALL